ncbi:sulfur carrier protein ThiS [Hyphomicrobium sp.]|uniref:sulfur carrier protein ThiS n=1 Tax=Hyphomicrobium sp. TaxID=82 RepID=UPI0025C2169F|nr:sulfur carrier protein ThiS [Hyphomicrobium sp.]MCC7251738.1 sulfur carrier protein ThiS [Hyphomicrobium sp.]
MTNVLTRPREITVNGAPVATGAETLAALVAEQGLAGRKVATAVNGVFVTERDQTWLAAGDRIEILSVRQGG